MIVVLGSNGQLGWELQQKLRENAVYLNRSNCDFSNLIEVRKLFSNLKPSLIINASAYTQVDKAETEKNLATVLNSDLPALLAEISLENKSKFVTYSTDYVFDGTSNLPLKESDETNPINTYGWSKLSGEKRVLEINPESLIIRTSWVYSVHGANFIKKIIELGRSREELRVVYDQVGTLTWAKDLAELTVNHSDLNGIFHFSGEGVSSWYDIAIQVKKYVGFKAKIEPVLSDNFPTVAKRPAYSILNKEKIKSSTGLKINHWMTSLEQFMHQSSL